MQVVLSFMAIGAFFLVSAIIETLVEGHSSSGNTLKDNKRLKRRRG